MFARDPEREDDLWSEPVVPPSTGCGFPLEGCETLRPAGSRAGTAGCRHLRDHHLGHPRTAMPPFCQVCRMWSRLPGRSRLPHDLLTWVCEGPGPARILCLESD